MYNHMAKTNMKVSEAKSITKALRHCKVETVLKIEATVY